MFNKSVYKSVPMKAESYISYYIGDRLFSLQGKEAEKYLNDLEHGKAVFPTRVVRIGCETKHFKL